MSSMQDILIAALRDMLATVEGGKYGHDDDIDGEAFAEDLDAIIWLAGNEK